MRIYHLYGRPGYARGLRQKQLFNDDSNTSEYSKPNDILKTEDYNNSEKTIYLEGKQMNISERF